MTVVSEPGDPWHMTNGKFGLARLAYGNIGCNAIDPQGFCTAGIWPTVSGAHWIWKTRLETPHQVRHGDAATFFKGFWIPTDATGISGSIQITADNAYRLFLNDVFVGADQDYPTVETFSITPQPAFNAFTIMAANSAEPALTRYTNPAGLAFRADITFSP
jgi:hypothetical protein